MHAQKSIKNVVCVCVCVIPHSTFLINQQTEALYVCVCERGISTVKKHIDREIER